MGASAVPAGEIRHIVIIGAGHGGGTAAAMLRQQGFEGDVRIFGPEPTGGGRERAGDPGPASLKRPGCGDIQAHRLPADQTVGPNHPIGVQPSGRPGWSASRDD